MSVGFINKNEVKKIEAPLVEDRFTNAICFGQTGSGKTTGFILPNIENRIKLNHGILIYDFKGNIHEYVKLLADKYNKLDKVHEIGKPWGKKIDILKYANTRTLENMFRGISGHNKDDYWENAALNLFENLHSILKNLYALIELTYQFNKDIVSSYYLKKEEYLPNLANIFSICKSAASIVDFFKVTKHRIEYFNQVIDLIISEDLNDKNKKVLNKILIYKKGLIDAYDALEEYHKIDASGGKVSGNNGVLQVLNNTLSSVARKDFLSKDEFDIVDALNRGEIVVINVQSLNSHIIKLLNMTIFDQMTARTATGVKSPVTVFIDECHKVLVEGSLPDVDVCRENGFEFIFATQDHSLLVNLLGPTAAYLMMRNITTQYSFRTTLEDDKSSTLGEFEYIDILTDKRCFAEPMFLDKRDLIEVECRYQLSKGIFDIVDIKTDERYVVRFSPLHIEKDMVLVEFIDSGKIEMVEIDFNTDLIDSYEIIGDFFNLFAQKELKKDSKEENKINSPLKELTNRVKDLDDSIHNIIKRLSLVENSINYRGAQR